MNRKFEYETRFERELRERNDEIVREYKERLPEVTSGQVTANRVIQLLADRYNMSLFGIKRILMKRGEYTPTPRRSHAEPSLFPEVATIL